MGLIFNPFTGNFDLIGRPSAVWTRIETTVNPGETKVVDQVSLSLFKALDYKCAAWTATKTKAWSQKVLNTIGDLSDTISERLGNASIEVQVLPDSGDCKLTIKNNEASILNVEVYKLTFGG